MTTGEEQTGENRAGSPRSTTGATREPLVVLEKVNKYFGDLHVLRDIDLTVHRGEVVVVIGPSGLGQVDAVPDHQPAGADRLGHDHARRQPLPDGGQGRWPGCAPRSGWSSSPSTSSRTRPSWRTSPSGRSRCASDKPSAEASAARELLDAGGHRRAGREVPGPALRRPAAARRDRPRPRDGAQGDALRRADLGPRPGDDQRGAGRDDRAGRATG